MTASDGNCSAGSCRICKAIEMKVAERTKAWWQSRWQRWWHRCHLQLPLVVEEDEQAFAFLSVHSSTLPEHWTVHTTGKPHWEAKKCTLCIAQQWWKHANPLGSTVVSTQNIASGQRAAKPSVQTAMLL